jgi:hypothetical protein
MCEDQSANDKQRHAVRNLKKHDTDVVDIRTHKSPRFKPCASSVVEASLKDVTVHLSLSFEQSVVAWVAVGHNHPHANTTTVNVG